MGRAAIRALLQAPSARCGCPLASQQQLEQIGRGDAGSGSASQRILVLSYSSVESVSIQMDAQVRGSREFNTPPKLEAGSAEGFTEADPNPRKLKRRGIFI